jgi:hypothetical protein
MERALQRTPPFYHPTDTSEDIVETVNSEILLHSNSHFPFSLHDDESNLHSDDGDETSKERAFERVHEEEGEEQLFQHEVQGE